MSRLPAPLWRYASACRRAIAALVAMAGFLLLLYWVSQAFGAYRSGQVSHAYFSDALETLDAKQPLLEWAFRAPPEGSDFTLYDGQSVASRVSEAWRLFAAALAQGEPELLTAVFTGPALSRAEQAARMAPAGGVHMITLGMQARATFYHLDRSTLQFEIDEALIARFRVTDTGLADYQLSAEQARTTVIKESTGWHIFAHRRLASTPIETAAARAGLSLDGETRLAGINYYPANAPWRAFWQSFDAEVVAQDFDLINALGANSIRIFLPRDTFLNPQSQPGALADLETLLTLAQNAELRVVPTLFDLKGSYEPATWAGDWLYLRTVLAALSGHSNIAFIDMKNEPDLDFDQAGEPLVTAWLTTMMGLARRAHPEFALTIGWSAADYADHLLATVDLVTYHDYAPAAGTAERLAQVRARVGSLPVMITEIGQTSWRGIPILASSSPQAQAQELSVRMQGLQASDGVFIWTLHDFADLDAAAIGGTFINHNRQRRFGLINPDGTEKPAARAVRAAFAGPL